MNPTTKPRGFFANVSKTVVVTLVLILFLLPFGSWYYLKQGLNWRKKAQEVMNGKATFPEGEWMDLTGKKFSSDLLENHVTLITITSCGNRQEMSDMLNDFYKQFRETGKSNIIIIDTCDLESPFSDPLKRDWYLFTCPDSMNLCHALLKSWETGKSHALVDKRRTIRSYYASQTTEQKRILLEHMALLLPRERSEKVELKRGEQQ